MQYFFLFPFSKSYEGRIAASYLKEIVLRIHWKDFHPSFIQQMLECSANFHRRSAQTSLAQVFPGLGFDRKSNYLTVYNPFKSKTVSNIFQVPVENTCTFLAGAFATNLMIWKSMQMTLYVSNSKEDFILWDLICCFHTHLTVSIIFNHTFHKQMMYRGRARLPWWGVILLKA